MAPVLLFFVMSVDFSRGYIPIGVEMLARLESRSCLPLGKELSIGAGIGDYFTLLLFYERWLGFT